MVLEFFIINKEFTIFVILLSLFLYLKRKNLDLQGSFPFFYVLMYKTKLGLGKMDSWSKNYPKIFLYLSYLSIFIGVIGIFLSLIFMVFQLWFVLEYDIKEGGGLVLPIKTDSGTIAGIPVVAPPFIEWIIALMVLVIVHEFAHGVIAERFKIRIKSSGFAFMGFFLPLLPAAFVEPDEKDLKKAAWWKQIAVFGAGSTSNFIFAVFFLLIYVHIAIPFTQNNIELESISFSSVMNQSSLKAHNMESGEILSINNKTISEFEFAVGNGMGPGMSDQIFIENLLNSTQNTEKINPDTYTLKISSNGVINKYEIESFKTKISGNKSLIGITNIKPKLIPKENSIYGTFPLFFQSLIFWIWLLNFGIGVMNLLPLWITDGGQITKTLLEKVCKKKKLAHLLLNILSIISLMLIILILFPALLKSLII